jgi:hypothetical protein
MFKKIEKNGKTKKEKIEKTKNKQRTTLILYGL